MASWLQNLLVLLIVAGCAAYILWQFVGTLRSRAKLGSCCAKGCPAPRPGNPQERIIFLPVEFLGRRR